MVDKKDQILLNLLKEDSSLSTYKIAKKTAIPQTTVLHRIRKLKEEGIIKKYTIDLDYKKLDKEVEKKTYGKIGGMEAKLAKEPLVMNVKRLMGKMDFVMEVIATDIDELNEFLITKVRKLDEV